jgi:hypothetical protein
MKRVWNEAVKAKSVVLSQHIHGGMKETPCITNGGGIE